MNASAEPPTRIRTAIALSIAAHLCVLGLLAFLLSDRDLALSSEVDGRVPGGVATLIRIERPGPRSVRSAAPRLAPPAPAPSPVARALVVRRAPTVAPLAAERTDRTGTSAARTVGGRTPAPLHFSLALTAAEPPEPTPHPVPSPSPVAIPSPAPHPSPTTAPAAVETPSSTAEPVAANFGGLFSQNYPPTLAAPSELAALRARISSPVRIRIDVDETGRATEVRFVRPLADADVEAQVRSTLLALRYVPADCNGLHCEGTLEIAY